ncbi:SDR family NAD(P)-dependent oxidoreductase [Streptomyces sp. NPDC057236]|uniref:SDR family NAD(P)-dependent oxidoreductase n=1 Tax=Streptomyces sp. NPDC057236 TaxID=3346059 RepID=UPI00363F4F5F
MSRVLVTGSADGLGLVAANAPLSEGHDVVAHARNEERAVALDTLAARGARVVVGDLTDRDAVRRITDELNDAEPLDAVIHNAGVWSGRPVMPVNVVAPYLLTALARVVARLRPGVPSNAVDPGRVPTRMGGPSAPDDLELGHRTQEWLVTSDEPEVLTTGGYWYRRQRQQPHRAVHDEALQDRLLRALAEETGTAL